MGNNEFLYMGVTGGSTTWTCGGGLTHGRALKNILLNVLRKLLTVINISRNLFYVKKMILDKIIWKKHA